MTTSDETFRLLYEVAVATSGVLEPERLAALAADRARRLTGADSTLLFWWVPERELLVLQATDPLGTAAIGCTRRRGEGAVGLAFETRSPQVVHARWEERQLELLSLLATLVAPALASARIHADLEASEESFRAVFADAHDQLLALVREFGLHRTDPASGGELVSMSEHQALMELSPGEELSQTALAFRLRLEKSTVSRLAAQMETRGWLERHRDTADARLVRLRLTPQGRELANELAVVRANRLQGLLRAIPEADRDAVLRALEVVVRALQRGPERPQAAAD